MRIVKSLVAMVIDTLKVNVPKLWKAFFFLVDEKKKIGHSETVTFFGFSFSHSSNHLHFAYFAPKKKKKKKDHSGIIQLFFNVYK
jgi:hypothetical protein